MFAKCSKIFKFFLFILIGSNLIDEIKGVKEKDKEENFKKIKNCVESLNNHKLESLKEGLKLLEIKKRNMVEYSKTREKRKSVIEEVKHVFNVVMLCTNINENFENIMKEEAAQLCNKCEYKTIELFEAINEDKLDAIIAKKDDIEKLTKLLGPKIEEKRQLLLRQTQNNQHDVDGIAKANLELLLEKSRKKLEEKIMVPKKYIKEIEEIRKNGKPFTIVELKEFLEKKAQQEKLINGIEEKLEGKENKPKEKLDASEGEKKIDGNFGTAFVEQLVQPEKVSGKKVTFLNAVDIKNRDKVEPTQEANKNAWKM